MSGGTGGLGGFETGYLAPGYTLAGYMDDTPVDGSARTLQGDALIILFEIDATMIEGGSIFRFHDGTNELKNPVIWRGDTYYPYPCKSEGWEFAGDNDTVSRPKLQVSNLDGVLSGLVDDLDDMIGARVSRRRTEARYLDAANFVSGNPGANPNAGWPDDIYYIERKVFENKVAIEFELASAADLQGAKLPKRITVAGTCPWVYKGSECGYSGGLPTCLKTLTDCKAHFGATAPLPFGGFPGVGRFRR